MPVTAVSMVADLRRKTLIRESKHGDTDTVTLDIWRYLDTEPVVTLDIYNIRSQYHHCVDNIHAHSRFLNPENKIKLIFQH